jgi:protein-disulfide isomerase
MPRHRRALLALALIPALAAAAFLFAQRGETDERASGLDREAVGEIVRDYILKNPEILLEAQQELAKRENDRVESRRAAALRQYKDVLETTDKHAVLGNPRGDVTLVEFFDYNCSFCRKAAKDLDALIAADPNLRVVLMEWPVIRQESLGAAQVSVAVSRTAPDKFRVFHERLFAGDSIATKGRALAVAKDLGLDQKAIEAAAAGPDVEATLLEVRALADGLGIEATPTYVIGDSVMPNTRTVVDDLQTRIAAVRQCGKASC